MKCVKNLDFFKNIKEVWEFEFGVFYYFDGLVISEIKEGVVFDWEMAEKAVKVAHQVFGEDQPIAYISNRINKYYVVPTDWIKFYKNRHQLSFYSVVGSTQGSFASLVLERMFFKNSIRQFNDLEEAIAWSMEKIKKRKQLA
ncbi:hypothetical protein FK220_013210 [Flavobacteriaceae bacterium TP-CH-4]|uniref:STAS/SEC14 domain-containing protein n=1 Tax=Pelagihabitans pacificus TaxID=2696054 RepID=A0A967ATW5_9FLAO|nr:hypothetical protein [Pelagihabitans pacificus]NHF60306.1 hypothetical protein [Pelagihabitans pacificus]